MKSVNGLQWSLYLYTEMDAHLSFSLADLPAPCCAKLELLLP